MKNSENGAGGTEDCLIEEAFGIPCSFFSIGQKTDVEVGPGRLVLQSGEVRGGRQAKTPCRVGIGSCTTSSCAGPGDKAVTKAAGSEGEKRGKELEIPGRVRSRRRELTRRIWRGREGSTTRK